MKLRELNARDMAVTALFAAILCVMSPWSIPVGPVPVSLATFAIYIAAAVMGRSRATIAVLVYILIGMVGLPVFSGFSGGFQKIAGVSGGYIVGYIPCAFISGAITDRFPKSLVAYPIGMILGTAILYLVGTAWFMYTTGNTLAASLGFCVVPFLLGDAIKIAAATALSFPLRRILAQAGKG